MSTKRVVLAEYFTTEDLTLLFIVREVFEEPEVIEIPKSLKEIQQFVMDRFREEWNEEGELVKSTSDQIRDLDQKAYQAFFEPFVAPLVSHSAKSDKGDLMTNEGDIIWLVPHDVLHYLPLHALKVDGQYLMERNPICYTPSASVMKYCHAKRKGRRETALVLGDSLNDLLSAREEALMVAQMFDTTPVLGQQATKSMLTEALEQRGDEIDILHLACHGYFDPYQPLKSGIKLAQGKNGEHSSHQQPWNLTAEEIFGLSMKADLVALTACESGVNERKPGDELMGLTRSLIYAGTPSVLVTLWRVSDLSTQILMKEFYTRLKAGLMKVEALRQAQTTYELNN